MALESAELQGVRGDAIRSRRSYVCEQCFGPLEVAYDYSRPRPGGGEAQDPGRLAGHLALRGLPALRRAGPRDPLEPGLTPLVRADRLAERLGLGERLDQERRRQPDPLLQGPGRRGRAREGAASSASRPSPAPRPATSPTPSPPTRPPPGLDSYVFVPADLEEQKLLATGVYGTNLVGVRGTYDDVNRLCTELAETRPWAFVNVNLRPYYAEGSKTLAFETVEQLGWELPDRVVCPIASGSLFTKIGQRLQRVARPRPGRGRAAGLQRRPGARAAARSPTAFAEGWDVCKPQRPDTIAKSLAIGDPADGPYALELARAHRRRDRVGHRRRDPRRDPAARRDHRDLHRDRRRRHDGGAREARRARRRSTPASGSSPTSPARG